MPPTPAGMLEVGRRDAPVILPFRVLLADDDAAVRQLMLIHLQILGHRVHAVCGGWAMLDLFRVGDYDLIVSDVEMPGGDGLTAAEAIRDAGAIPIVMMSGGWTADYRVRAAAIGAVCLQKPFDRAALAAAITAVTTGPPWEVGRDSSPARPRPAGGTAALRQADGQPG
jgi:DNA-binding response OmpR family regulator